MYNEQVLAFPGLRAKRDNIAFSYPALSAAAISASFSTLIKSSFSSNASAMSSKIFFLSSDGRAYNKNQSNNKLLSI